MKPVQIIAAATALVGLLGLSLWWAFGVGSHDALADLRQKPVPIAFAGTPPALPRDLVLPEEVRPGTVSQRSRALWIAEEHWSAYATAEAAAALLGELKAGKVLLFPGAEPPAAVTRALGVVAPTLPPVADDATRQHAFYLWQDQGGMIQAGVVLGRADLTARRLHEALVAETARHLDHQSRNALVETYAELPRPCEGVPVADLASVRSNCWSDLGTAHSSSEQTTGGGRA